MNLASHLQKTRILQLGFGFKNRSLDREFISKFHSPITNTDHVIINWDSSKTMIVYFKLIFLLLTFQQDFVRLIGPEDGLAFCLLLLQWQHCQMMLCFSLMLIAQEAFLYLQYFNLKLQHKANCIKLLKISRLQPLSHHLSEMRSLVRFICIL